MKKLALVAASVTFAIGLMACSPNNSSTLFVPVQALVSGINVANMDKSVRPQDDFYRYVDGKWLERTVIPADKSNYGSFGQLYDAAQVKLRQIIERTAAKVNKTHGSNEQKLGDFYTSYMDEENAEKLGFMPLNGELLSISSINSRADVGVAFAHLNHIGVRTPLVWDVDNDEKNSSQYVVAMRQSGLGLPDRDYYLEDTEKFNRIRSSYQTYITNLLNLIGYADADKAAEHIMALETSIAKTQWTQVERRDPVKSYNKLTTAQMNDLMGGLNWSAYAKEAHLDQATEVVVRQPSYISSLAKTLETTPVTHFKDYLTFHLVNSFAQSLSKAFVDLHYDFFDRNLRGLQAPPPRWKKAVDATDVVVGEILGKFYVEETFSPEAKTRMETMVKNLMKGYSKRIDGLEWMTDETKVAAQQKLSKFTYKIGYPDKWKDYSPLDIAADDLAGNGMRSAAFSNNEMANRLGKPIDKTLWHMTPQTINAYYNPVMNEIVFPAAILQPPFFNMAADDAVNYGGIGAVIGHELGHGFDDSGAQYDGDGNLRDWWSASDKAEFEKRSKQFVEQYNAFKPFDDASVNGQLTLGENIGDLGGMIVAFEAYHLSLDGKEAPVIDGFTGDQRFFFGWAQVWRRKYREQELRKRLMTDPHSPSEYRVNGIMWNMPEFYQTFGVKEGDKLYLKPEDRVKIW
jgi:putative endopeptidase